MAELKAKVSLDTRAFNVGLTRMRRNVGRFAGKVGGQFAQAGANLARNAGRLAIGAGAAIVGATVIAARFGDQIDKMAKRTGIGTEALSALGFASEITGSKIEDVEKAIARQQLSLKQASDGLTTATRGYDELGLSVEALMAMSPEDQFMATAKAIGEVADESRRSALAQEVFGRAGRKIIPLLTADLKLLTAEAMRLGIIITPEQADAAAELTDDFLKLKKSVLGVALSAGVMKPAASLIKELTAAVVRLRESGALAAFADSMREGARSIIANTRGIIGAWRSMSTEQRDKLKNMAKAGAGFVAFWKLGFMRPLVTITAALVGQMMAMLNPAVMLGGLLGIPAFIAGIGIGKAFEKQLGFSDIILKISAAGFAILDAISTVIAPIKTKIEQAASLVMSLMRGEFGKIEEAANAALKINLGDDIHDGLEDMGAKIKATIDQMHNEFDAIDEFNPPPITEPIVDWNIGDAIMGEFAGVIDMVGVAGKAISDKLVDGLGVDGGTDALASFLSKMKEIKDESLDLGLGGKDGDGGLGNAADEAERLARATAPFRGGRIMSVEVGALAGKGLAAARAAAAKGDPAERQRARAALNAARIRGERENLFAPKLRAASAANVGQMKGDFSSTGEILGKIHGTLMASLGVQKQIADKGVIMGFA